MDRGRQLWHGLITQLVLGLAHALRLCKQLVGGG